MCMQVLFQGMGTELVEPLWVLQECCIVKMPMLYCVWISSFQTCCVYNKTQKPKKSSSSLFPTSVLGLADSHSQFYFIFISGSVGPCEEYRAMPITFLSCLKLNKQFAINKQPKPTNYFQAYIHMTVNVGFLFFYFCIFFCLRTRDWSKQQCSFLNSVRAGALRSVPLTVSSEQWRKFWNMHVLRTKEMV